MFARIDVHMPTNPAMPELSAPSRNDTVMYSASVLRVADRVGGFGRAQECVADVDHDGHDDRQNRDRPVLARQKRLGALLDRVGDALHLGLAAFAREHPSRQPDGEQRVRRRWRRG